MNGHVVYAVFAEAVSGSSADNSDNESARSSVDETMEYAMRKARPPCEDFDEDVREIVSKEVCVCI